MDNQEPDFGLGFSPEVPNPTVWERKCSFFGFYLDYVPAIKNYFLNSIELGSYFPAAVIFMILSSFIVYFEIPRNELNLHSSFTALLAILMILFITSYIIGVFTGPGYLPFYYQYNLTSNSAIKPDYLSGLISTKEQLQYIKKQELPPKCQYMKDARRVVIMPDHLCIWFTVYIGKKNYKLFFLFNLYGFLYTAIFIVFMFWTLVNLVNNPANPLKVLFVVVYLMMAFIFCMLTVMFLFDCLINTTKGQTNEEKVSDTVQKHNKACCANFEEVCGPRSSALLWLLPIPAFMGKENSSLIYMEDPYKML